MHHISAGSLKSSQEWMHILPHHQCKFLTKTFYKKSGRHFKKLHILNVSMHNFRRQESFVPAIIHTPLRSSSGSSGLIYCKTFVHPPTLFLNVLVKHFSKGVFGLLTSSMHPVSQLYYNFHRFKRKAARRLIVNLKVLGNSTKSSFLR